MIHRQGTSSIGNEVKLGRRIMPYASKSMLLPFSSDDSETGEITDNIKTLAF